MNTHNRPVSLGELADKLGITARPVSMGDVAEFVGYKKQPIELGELADAVEKFLAKSGKK